MGENLPCARHEEQIKTLFKRVEGVESMKDFMYSLDKNMALQTQLMANVVEHNKQQDIKMEEFQNVIVSVNSNLTKLNEGQVELKDRVDTIEKKVENNENKHLVDMRDIDKEKNINILKKWGVPFSVGIAIGTFLLKFFEIWKG